MSSPASAIELRATARIAELVTVGSLEISPRELHRAAEVAALLPKDTCVYIPSLPGLPLSRTLEMVAALRAAGLDPVPHVSARRILNRNEFRPLLKEATSPHGVHRVLVIGGTSRSRSNRSTTARSKLRSGMPRRGRHHGDRRPGYPEGHPRIAASALDQLQREVEAGQRAGPRSVRRDAVLVRAQARGVICAAPARSARR
jgi:methylenetetrahydrofolate reductase (NADPH)